MNDKLLAGKEIAKYVQDGQIIGIGSGSTVQIAVQEIGERIRNEGLKIKALTTSLAISLLCAENNITVLDSVSFKGNLDWGLDGADEVDPNGRIIKGQGAAMLIEKIIAKRCKDYFIVVDASKLVNRLGEKFPVPVEIVPEALFYVEEKLKSYQGVKEVTVRTCNQGKFGPVVTDKGNLVLDVSFTDIPRSAEDDLKKIVGVVETGIFDGIVNKVIIGSKNGVEIKSFSYGL